MLLAALLLATQGSAPQQLRAQVLSTQTPRLPTADQNTDEANTRNREFQEKLQRARESERQKRIVDDANRLVQLAAAYRKALDAHGTPTADDQKLLLQMEKLAREVKDRMRGM